MDYEQVRDYFSYPRTVRKGEWIHYLNRNLTKEEHEIIDEFKSEHRFNNSMRDLHMQCYYKGLYVPQLTNLWGDCMFESLIYHGIGRSVQDLRRGLAWIMYVYKDFKNFFPNQETTLAELFSMTNEIEYVSCRQKTKDGYTKKFYKYTYNTMCQDLTNSYSWSKLPTQLIMMVISRIFNLDIVVVSDGTNYENSINVYQEAEEKPEMKTIYLGHIGETHYVPVDEGFVEMDDAIYYNDARKNFLRWAKVMENIKVQEYMTELERRQMETLSDSSPDDDKNQQEREEEFCNAECDNNESNLVDFSSYIA